MKVKHLIEILSKFDNELDVGVLHDNGVDLAEEVGIYEGWLSLPYGHKMICHKKRKQYVAIGNPGNYEVPAYHDNNKPIEVYDVFQDGTISKD
jgi:hypothetical protein